MKSDVETLPEENNFYACFKNISKATVKNILESNGWNVRKSGWDEFELTNEWSELILEGSDEELLLNGAVVYIDHNISEINRVFLSMKTAFIYEFYDFDKNLILDNKVGWG